MIMKQFLLEKINTFTVDTLTAFNSLITNNLPSESQSFKVWGSNENGFWYLEKAAAYFFENDGTFHIIDNRRNQDFYNSIVTLYTENEKLNIIRMSKPLEFDTLSLENDDHAFGLPKGQVLYYTKFSTPTGEYGMPWELIKLKGNPVTDVLYTLANQTSELLGVCKRLNIGFYYFDDTNPILLDDDGYFLFIPSPNEDSIDLDVLMNKMDITELDHSFVEYGKHKFHEQT